MLYRVRQNLDGKLKIVDPDPTSLSDVDPDSLQLYR